MSEIANLNSVLIQQVENWRSKLLDLGGRNPLINTSFHPSRGVLELAHPDTEKIWKTLVTPDQTKTGSMRLAWKRHLVPNQTTSTEDWSWRLQSGESPEEVKNKDWNPPVSECRKSVHLKPNDLLTSLSDKALDRRIRTLDGHAKLSLTEQGINCLFLVFGFIKWFDSPNSEKELWSPLMLVPAAFSRETSESPWELFAAEDDVVDNLSLRQRLRQDLGMELPPLPELEQLEEDGARLEFLSQVRNTIKRNERWEVQDRCCVGRFVFPKIAMWKDLGDHTNSIVSHSICQAIAGRLADDPQAAFGDPSTIPTAEKLDDAIEPGEVKAILDCDSSQLEAIVAARQGISFVLDGPPGTGKSQTIANIIADALGEGKRVLFVSEKVAALEVVKRRLDESGLGDFCLECHSQKANRKTILEELKWCLELPAESYSDPNPKLMDLRKQRQILNQYIRSLHQKLSPIGLSLYELQGHLVRLTAKGVRGESNINFPNLDKISRGDLESWKSLLEMAPNYWDVLATVDSHPWRNCKLTSQSLTLKAEVQRNLGGLLDSTEKLIQTLKPLEDDKLISKGTTLASLDSLIDLLQRALTAPNIPAAWLSSPREIAAALLRRHFAYQKIQKLKPLLSDYVDDVTSHFTKDLITLGNPQGFLWETRLTASLPGNYEIRQQQLSAYAQTLRTLEQTGLHLENEQKHLFRFLPLPIRNLSLNNLDSFLTVAKLVAEYSPFQKSWFDADCLPRVNQVAERAARLLEEEEKLLSDFEDRVAAKEILKLAQQFPDEERLRISREAVRNWNPVASPADLDSYLSKLANGIRILEEIQSDYRSIASNLQWCFDDEITISELQSLVKALPDFLPAGFYHGSWKDAETRSFIKSVIQTVLLDLEEARELRKELEPRFSHRAFLPNSRGLIQRGTQFSSFWSRITGGFSDFRTEFGDIYKGSLSDTRTLLNDIRLLGKFHKFMEQIETSHKDVSKFLLPGLVIDDENSWLQNINAIQAFENLLVQATRFTQKMPGGFVGFSLKGTDPPVVRLSSKLERAITSEDYVSDDWWGIAQGGIFSGLVALRERESALRLFADALELSQKIYKMPPADFDQLLSDHSLAVKMHSNRNELNEIINNHRNDLPVGEDPCLAESWRTLKKRAEAANKLMQLLGSPKTLSERLFVRDGIAKEGLKQAISRMESAFKDFKNIWSRNAGFITLATPGKVVADPKRQTISELIKHAADAAGQFQSLADLCAVFLRIQRPGSTLLPDQLQKDVPKIEELKTAENAFAEATRVLEIHHIEQALEFNTEELATIRLIAESDESLFSMPLGRAVAASPDRREQLREIITQLRQTSEKMVDPQKFLKSLLDSNQVTECEPQEFSLHEYSQWIKTLLSTTDSIDEWIRFSRWRTELNEKGLGSVVKDLYEKKYLPDDAADVVFIRLYQQLFDCYAENLSSIRDFDSTHHEQVREKYRELDQWEIRAASTRVREFQLGRSDRPRLGSFNPGSSEVGLLYREIQKKRRHLSLRKLFGAIPTVLQKLKPCIMMSPLSVSTFLESESVRFDLVIFDEASQVFPWDAIGAIYRGSQLIVAGDEKQLPPTSFFSRTEIDVEDEQEEDDIGDFESILSLCKSVNMPNKRLRWHYRSRREPLIAFSNKNFYDGDLVTFPSVRDAAQDSVQLIYVPEGRWIDRKNEIEARKVADLVIEHYRERPEKSLGVIAFNISQQQAIEDAIYDLRRSCPITDALLKQRNSEPLFVKNLENVQGDERDVILLSFGFGKNEAGKFLKNFGPLSKKNGERRLNVAVTRAREAVRLVASVQSSDMDLSDNISIGAQLLKAYLDYAQNGVDSLSRSISETQGKCESPFEEEVAAALIRQGLQPVPQVGCGGFRIDFALKHPLYPGLFCLGIECDGATYHSSKTARDRDRIRQEILEGLGWRICRIWSTDWIRNPSAQIQKILTAYEEASSQTTEFNSNDQMLEDLEFDDLQPVYLNGTHHGSSYSKIQDVPHEQIQKLLIQIVSRVGTIETGELVSLTSRELGFARAGNKIRRRLESVLENEIELGSLHSIGERISLPAQGRDKTRLFEDS